MLGAMDSLFTSRQCLDADPPIHECPQYYYEWTLMTFFRSKLREAGSSTETDATEASRLSCWAGV